MQSLKGVLSVLAPFILGLVTSYLSDRRSKRQEDHAFLIDDYKQVVQENKDLRAENERLRKESNNETKH